MKIAVIGGGTSGEADVSRASAQQVLSALQDSHDATYFELDAELTYSLPETAPDVVFPVLHGAPGEDGTFQGYLDMLQLAYVGSGVAASALAMNKFVAKRLFSSVGIPVLESIAVSVDNLEASLDAVERQFNNRVAVKPQDQGSALGVTLLPSGGDVRQALTDAFEVSDRVLVEPYVAGREITVGVLDLAGAKPTALPVIEIQVATGEWYDFANRYTAGKSRHVIPPRDLSQVLLRELANNSLQAHHVLGCHDLSRADFVLQEDGRFWLLEVNTMPGMTPTSLYPDAARASGISFAQLADQLVQSAYKRFNSA